MGTNFPGFPPVRGLAADWIAEAGACRPKVVYNTMKNRHFRATPKEEVPMPTPGNRCCRPIMLTALLLLCTNRIMAQENAPKVQILPPGSPAQVKPPVVTEEEADQILQEKKRLRREDEERDAPPPPTPALVREQKLAAASQQDLPSRLHMSLTFAATQIKTFGKKRQNYTSDPTALLHVYLRPGSSDQPAGTTRFWTGFRLAPLTGTGVYENIPANYGFVYFGPMIGLGKISPAVASISDDAAKNPTSRPADFETSGFFWMSGIAAQSRIGSPPPGGATPRDDINTKGVAFDAPGLWTEVTYTSIKYKLYSTNYMFGLQGGNAKLWVYLGMGFGFWH